jgi:predicted aspartyl protease
MLEKTRKEFDKTQKPLSQIIASVQTTDRTYWRFNFITKTLEIVSFEINAKTGKIEKTEAVPLTK